MNLTKPTKFILAIGLQLVILFAIIVYKLMILSSGNTIFLQIEPVDPTDPFRGDYVTFRYDISTVNSWNINGENIRNGDTVYVILEKYSKYYTINRVQKTKPKGDGVTFIKGVVIKGAEQPLDRKRNSFDSGDDQLEIRYGIEEYYIPEGTGRDVSFFNKDVGAEVVVDDDGKAVLKQLYLEGKKWP